MSPGFTISGGGSESSGSDGLHVLLYYSDDVPVSLIQKRVVEGIDGYETEIHDVTGSPGAVHNHNVTVVPTTIVMDSDYEVERWETVVHRSDIVEVLSGW